MRRNAAYRAAVEVAMREYPGYSQRQLAEMLDIPIGSISRIIRSLHTEPANDTPAAPPSTAPKRHIIIPDCQVKDGVDLEYLSWVGQYIADQRPDRLIQIGDFADMPSLSSYDRGKKSFEGRRYKKDVQVTRDSMHLLMSPIWEAQHKSPWAMTQDLTLGNHECYDDETEVLSRAGWKLFKSLQVGEEVFTLSSNGEGEWQPVSAVICKPYSGTLKRHSSRTVDIAVTPKHRMVWTNNGSGKVYEGTADASPAVCDLFVSAESGCGVKLTDDELRFIAIALTDSRHGPYQSLTFYQSGAKADVVRNIITSAGVEFKEKVRCRDTQEICGRALVNPPQPCHEFYMRRPAWCPEGNKRLPELVFNLTPTQFSVLLDTLIYCDGTIPTKAVASRVFYGRKEICEDLQAACVTKGYRATLSQYRPNQWRVNITKTRLCRVERFLNASADESYSGYVWCASVPNETLMVRRRGKPVFCGNCRIDRVVEDDARLDGTIGMDDLGYEGFGWNVHPYLQPVNLDGVNYAHFFTSGVMGRPVCSARALIAKKHESCVMGHVQMHDVATAYRVDGRPIIGLFVGACYLHNEDYLGPQGNHYWRGIWVLNEVLDGDFQLMQVSLDYLRRKYG